MEIANWMTRDPVCVTPHDTLAKAKLLMDAGHFRRLPVMDSGKLEAIISERDLRQHWGYLDSTKVSPLAPARCVRWKHRASSPAWASPYLLDNEAVLVPGTPDALKLR
jgi:CBS-domain-containing membrane protein